MASLFPAARRALAAGWLALAMLAGARAEDTPQPPQPAPVATPPGAKSGGVGGRASASPLPAAAEPHRLPPDSSSRQTLSLPERTLSFTATAGSIRLFDDKGEPQADIVYTAYQLDGADPQTRPVTFFFNGGPGSASAWLQFGNAGAWWLDLDAATVSLALDPKLKILIGHGLFDLATPYFGSKMLLDQLPAYAAPPRVKLVVYPGGHMFYTRAASRQSFRAEAEALIKQIRPPRSLRGLRLMQIPQPGIQKLG